MQHNTTEASSCASDSTKSKHDNTTEARRCSPDSRWRQCTKEVLLVTTTQTCCDSSLCPLLVLYIASACSHLHLLRSPGIPAPSSPNLVSHMHETTPKTMQHNTTEARSCASDSRWRQCTKGCQFFGVLLRLHEHHAPHSSHLH